MPVAVHPKVLVAENDPPLASFVRRGLEADAYAVEVAGDGEVVCRLAGEGDFDLVILDLNLLQLDGVRVLESIREHKPALPVLVLSSRSRVEERVLCLEVGADDYLTKPFSFSELSARVRALLRRSERPVETVLRVEDVELDRVTREVTRDGRRIELTSKEFALLEFLMLHAGRPVTRALILDKVWNFSFDTMTNVVEVYVNYLRRKLEREGQPPLIRTLRGKGYQIGEARP